MARPASSSAPPVLLLERSGIGHSTDQDQGRRPERNRSMLTPQTAQQLKSGDTVYCTYPRCYNKGIPARVRVTSVKIDRTHGVVVKFKHGLKDYGSISGEDFANWTTDYQEALDARPPLPKALTDEINAKLETAAQAPANNLAMLQAAKAAAIEAAYAGRSISVAMIRAMKATKAQQDAAFDRGDYVN